MMKERDKKEALQYLKTFDFNSLFIEILGWNHPRYDIPTILEINGVTYELTPVAEKRGFIIYHYLGSNQQIPTRRIRQQIDQKITPSSYTHIIIFSDEQQQIWQWFKRDAKKTPYREHSYNINQSGALILQKLENILINFDEETNLTLSDVTFKAMQTFYVERVTKEFFEKFQEKHLKFVDEIQGIKDKKDANWYASVILNRLMFVYFLQKKGFLDQGNRNYLNDKLNQSKSQGKNLYYSEFLRVLFFDAFAKPESQRTPEIEKKVGKIKYLNGGLFLPHPLELKYPEIQITDKAFESAFNLFSSYSWHLDDTPTGNDNEINPDVLGYIFEKYINQKAFGAYYTRPEITGYLCEKTINKYLINQLYPNLSSPSPSGMRGLGGEGLSPSEIKALGSENFSLNNEICNVLLDHILPQLSILDPACGSGAFLVAILQHLITIYQAIFDYLETQGDEKNQQRLQGIKKQHHSLNYYIKKRIITDNIYGVDIMEEAVEIAKLRLFLSLVASAETVEALEPLPNIDFNIRSGNSLIGLIRVDGDAFAKLGEKNAIQGSLLSGLALSEYETILREKNESIKKYKDYAFAGGDVGEIPQEDRLLLLKKHIEDVNKESQRKLNQLLLDEFSGKLKIKYEEIQLTGKATKRLLTLEDMSALKPFHWGYHFDKIIREKGGFDIILTNPPWEVFQTDEKEFFIQYDSSIQKNKTDIKTWKKKREELLKNPEIAKAWLDYCSTYPYASAYFKKAEQYKNQRSEIGGKSVARKINLYFLFVEQCFNLLKSNGECGLVIPSGIYTDLGTKQLREMLFSKTRITGLFCFENKKEIFEGVHRSFKFVILTFEKVGETVSFPAKFMCHEVKELQNFPDDETINIKVDLVKKLSPDSLSVMEFKGDLDITIAEKMSQFPLLGKEIEGKWNLKLTQEFNMTTDSHLFKTESGKGGLPLYEGKMIHQFNHLWGHPKYWLDEKEARQALLGKKKADNGQILDYQCYRLGFRDIARNTDIRTMIATILPRKLFTGNTIITSQEFKNNKHLLILVACLNSFISDYIIRQKVTAHCNMFYVYQLPIPRLTKKDEYFVEIVERSAKLICTSPEFDDLAKEIGLIPHSLTPSSQRERGECCFGVINEVERGKIRAELDAIIAHLYGLTEIELKHILSTFPLVSEDVKTAVLEEFNRF